jgi:hypothetical protein
MKVVNMNKVSVFIKPIFTGRRGDTTGAAAGKQRIRGQQASFVSKS